MSKNFRTMTLKERFDRRGFAVSAYARAYDVDHGILSKVLEGVLDGSKGHRGGSTRRIIAQLKADKIWIGKLPWDVVVTQTEEVA